MGWRRSTSRTEPTSGRCCARCSDLPSSEGSAGAKVKLPFEDLVSTVRALGSVFPAAGAQAPSRSASCSGSPVRSVNRRWAGTRRTATRRLARVAERRRDPRPVERAPRARRRLGGRTASAVRKSPSTGCGWPTRAPTASWSTRRPPGSALGRGRRPPSGTPSAPSSAARRPPGCPPTTRRWAGACPTCSPCCSTVPRRRSDDDLRLRTRAAGRAQSMPAARRGRRGGGARRRRRARERHRVEPLCLRRPGVQR